MKSRSYILRLWITDEPETSDWLASLDDPSTGERFGFSGLEQLFAFLMEQSERDWGGLASSSRSGVMPGENQMEVGT